MVTPRPGPRLVSALAIFVTIFGVVIYVCVSVFVAVFRFCVRGTFFILNVCFYGYDIATTPVWDGSPARWCFLLPYIRPVIRVGVAQVTV